MERESFIFYKSFYEAIIGLPNDIKLEVLTDVIEYALFGRLPENPKPVAKGMFTLIKPNIDVNNSRFANGKKGGRKKKLPSAKDTYAQTYEKEVEQMRADDEWRKTICNDFNISSQEFDKRLTRFLCRCNEDKDRKGKAHHDSFADCQSHLRYWMSKAYPAAKAPAENTDNNPLPPTSDYTFTGGFGGIDV